MKFASALFASALILTSAGVAAADTIQLDSYGTPSQNKTVSVPSGAGNSALSYYGSTDLSGNNFVAASSSSTYDLTTGISPWTAAQGGSYWVSQNAGNAPGGSNVEPSGGYVFYTTFTVSNPAHASGSITVMADDTTGIYLNGNLITLPASPATAGTCDSGTPNCTVPTTFLLPGADFVSGTNYLSFDVLQEHGSAEGLDFVGQVNVTPEPDSLLLLGTGLAMMAGFAYYRRVQA